jgi:hypothetical protein
MNPFHLDCPMIVWRIVKERQQVCLITALNQIFDLRSLEANF